MHRVGSLNGRAPPLALWVGGGFCFWRLPPPHGSYCLGVIAPLAKSYPRETGKEVRLSFGGGSAMAIKYVGITRERQDQLGRSQVLVRKRISTSKDMIPKRLFSQLTELVDPEKKNAFVELSVRNQVRDLWAFSNSTIEIDPKCFEPQKGKSPNHQDPPRLTAVLLHELVHISGGDELDAEFFENRLFTLKDGARLPTPTDEEDFKEHGYKGEFVQLDPASREVRERGTQRVLGKLERQALPESSPNALPIVSEPSDNNQKNFERGATMPSKNEEDLAKMRIDKMKQRKNQVGVRVVVELTGYMKKTDLRQFMNGIRACVEPRIEGNGGGGS